MVHIGLESIGSLRLILRWFGWMSELYMAQQGLDFMSGDQQSCIARISFYQTINQQLSFSKAYLGTRVIMEYLDTAPTVENPGIWVRPACLGIGAPWDCLV